MSNGTSEALVALESQVAFQEHTIEQLNEALISQQQQIDVLRVELRLLSEKFGELDDRVEHSGSAKDEKPPHY
ncbi:MAG: SlyX family protein [Gammaproteobacteria bacterium]